MFITSRTSLTSRNEKSKAYILATILNFLRKYPKECIFLLKIVLFRVLMRAYQKSEWLAGLRACVHGGGGAQVGEVTQLGGGTRLSI